VTSWAKVIEGKIAIATKANQQGMKPGKVSVDARIPQGQSRVSDLPVLDMGWIGRRGHFVCSDRSAPRPRLIGMRSWRFHKRSSHPTCTA